MLKRKDVNHQDVEPDESASEKSMSEESSSDEDTDMLNVEFEWFDPQPKFDFHGIKTLLRQLFDTDALLVDLSAITDLVLAQPLLGSTVKVEGNETDPYAFLTVLNLKEHKDKPAIRELQTYLTGRAKSNPISTTIVDVMDSATASIGLVLTERLINVPAEVVPPMYNMLQEEVDWALEDKEPYDFSHYLVLSKKYQEIESSLDNEDDTNRKHKKQKKSNTMVSPESFNFHPEDEILRRYALAHVDFDYANKIAEWVSDSKRTFQDLGIKANGQLILLEANKFKGAVKAMQDYFRQE